MTRQRGRTIGKAKAIKNTLDRLGMQASNKEVAASLASYGIDVSEGLVQRVRVELLKQPDEFRRQRAMVPTGGERPRVRRPPKMPPGRTYRP